jgi:putative membrane protein
VGGDPIDELTNHHLVGIAVAVVLGILVLGVGLFTVSWRASTFRIDGDAVTVRNGVLIRTTRTARLDRIQGITISRPLLARLVGAARIELDVAGQNANVRLEYLTNTAAEGLRRDVLRLASGKRHAEAAHAAEVAGEPLDGTGPPAADAEYAILEEAGTPILQVTPGRAIGSVVLSQTTLVLVVVAAIVLPVLNSLGAGAVGAVSLFPTIIATVTVGLRRVGRNLRYTVVATPDGVRIGSGIVSTSTEAVPPGRVHAVRIEQPLVWRPAGWWRVSVNRAGHAGGRRNADAERTLAPVATLAEVRALVPNLVPDLLQRQDALTAGLVGAGRDDGFTPAPRRARWLRPAAWRRTGFLLTEGTVLLRGGFLRRELVIVPEARIQSVALRQGPAERLLDVATVEPHVVSGPVRTRLGLIDRARAEALFGELAETGARARAADTSHRWAERIRES